MPNGALPSRGRSWFVVELGTNAGAVAVRAYLSIPRGLDAVLDNVPETSTYRSIGTEPASCAGPYPKEGDRRAIVNDHQLV